MKIENDDYVIANYRNKPALFFVLNGNSGKSVLEETSQLDNPTYVTLEKNEILCNLGQNPDLNTGKKAFGVTVAPFRKMLKSEKYGNMYLHRPLGKKEKSQLSKCLSEVYSLYEEKASVEFLPVYKMALYPKQGKYAGLYKARNGKTMPLDEIHFFCKFENSSEGNYIIAHEWAHGLWFRCINTRIKVKWINLYQRRLNIFESSEKEMTDLLNSIINYESIRGYIKEVADEVQKKILKEVIKYWSSYHKLKLDAMNMILLENKDDFASYWPSHSTIKEEISDISSYSMKNVDEFFAESFSHWILGFRLPKDVTKACAYTAKQCRLHHISMEADTA